MKKITTRAIYIQVPEKDYRVFKIFACSNHMTLQMFLRSAAYHFIRESQKHKTEDVSND